ncbi:MAG: nuclear transport factor 2 family protein [Gemmatimonadaceae bacterium]|nr:nuclear transport factor 2 family protein [Gemmatimonadaceae bacterium]
MIGSLMLAPAPMLQAQSAADRDAVRRAVLNYVEGFYEGDTAKLVRSVRPEVVKYGYFIPKGKTTYEGEGMPWAEFMSYTNQVKKRGKPTPPTSPKLVTLLDVADQTASAKLTAWWGIDYLHLAKFDGVWMITQVLWQSPPPVPR